MISPAHGERHDLLHKLDPELLHVSEYGVPARIVRLGGRSRNIRGPLCRHGFDALQRFCVADECSDEVKLQKAQVDVQPRCLLTAECGAMIEFMTFADS